MKNKVQYFLKAGVPAFGFLLNETVLQWLIYLNSRNGKRQGGFQTRPYVTKPLLM